MSQVDKVDIELADGSSISVDTDIDGDVLMVVDANNGHGINPVVMKLSPPVAAYLAGQIAARSGVVLGAEQGSL